MAFSRSAVFFILIVMFFSDLHTGSCKLQNNPTVQTIKEVLDNKLVSTECSDALKMFTQSLNEEGTDDVWASEMLDATSKIPVDMISYTFGDIGHFYECIEVKSQRDNIRGKYCIGDIVVNASVADSYSQQVHVQDLKRLTIRKANGAELIGQPSWAMCLPSNCTEQDSKLVMNKLQPFGFGMNSVSCQTFEDAYPKLTRDAFIGISILSFLAAIVLISTSYDIYCQNRKKAHPALTAFSLVTNGRKIFKSTKRSSNISCLDGIRVLSMFWIFILHVWSVYKSGPIFNPKDVADMSNSILSMIFINGDLACDTFLMVGGILITYVYFTRSSDKALTVSSIFRHYLHRIIRLTPSLAGVVLISGTLLRYMGSGPKWPYIVIYFEGFCKKSWWSTLLYIHNEVNVSQMCVGHSWYLDVDMQLYLFSPFIFWMLSKYSKTGIGLLIFSTFSSISLAFFRAFEDELSGIHPNTYSKTSSNIYMNEYYLKTETRAAPWIMGTLLGYFLSKKDFNEVRLPKKITVVMWILSLSVMLLCVFGGFNTLRGPDYEKLQNAFYIAFVRPSFAMAVGWVIWACSTNHGGLVNTILSLPIFGLLNKFVYSMYLIHVTSLYIITFSSKTSAYISIFNLAYWFWGIFMFMFGISIIWVLIFESPMITLEKLILQPFVPKESKQIREKC